MTELNYPKHKHPHGINKTENNQRIWVCDECDSIFTDKEIREDSKLELFGHTCKCRDQYSMDVRCESHLESYIPEI